MLPRQIDQPKLGGQESPFLGSQPWGLRGCAPPGFLQGLGTAPPLLDKALNHYSTSSPVASRVCTCGLRELARSRTSHVPEPCCNPGDSRWAGDKGRGQRARLNSCQ